MSEKISAVLHLYEIHALGIADKIDPQIGVDFSSEQGGKPDA